MHTVSQATTIASSQICISKDATISPRNAAGHEAFHFWKSGQDRDAYIEAVRSNLLFTSETFLEYQSTIAQAYLGGELDLSNDRQSEKLHEELFAYLSGDIHEGTNDDFLRPMFRRYDAVKAAWRELLRQNGAGGSAFSLQGDNAAADMPQE